MTILTSSTFHQCKSGSTVSCLSVTLSQPLRPALLQWVLQITVITVNHRKRKSDEFIPALNLLPTMGAAINGHVLVSFNSSLRCGDHVFKALQSVLQASCLVDFCGGNCQNAIDRLFLHTEWVPSTKFIPQWTSSGLLLSKTSNSTLSLLRIISTCEYALWIMTPVCTFVQWEAPFTFTESLEYRVHVKPWLRRLLQNGVCVALIPTIKTDFKWLHTATGYHTFPHFVSFF